ncbi:MAG: winged helix DNA-binding protein [Promethearchaeota archaeon]
MSGYPPVTPRPELPEEFQFLCMLHNVGAITPERALTIAEIARWTNEDTSLIKNHLERLHELGYVQSMRKDETLKYYVSVMGIRKVLTLYS